LVQIGGSNNKIEREKLPDILPQDGGRKSFEVGEKKVEGEIWRRPVTRGIKKGLFCPKGGKSWRDAKSGVGDQDCGEETR